MEVGIACQVSTTFGQIIEKVKKAKHHVCSNPITLPLNSSQDETKKQSQHATAHKIFSRCTTVPLINTFQLTKTPTHSCLYSFPLPLGHSPSSEPWRPWPPYSVEGSLTNPSSSKYAYSPTLPQRTKPRIA